MPEATRGHEAVRYSLGADWVVGLTARGCIEWVLVSGDQRVCECLVEFGILISERICGFWLGRERRRAHGTGSADGGPPLCAEVLVWAPMTPRPGMRLLVPATNALHGLPEKLLGRFSACRVPRPFELGGYTAVAIEIQLGGADGTKVRGQSAVAPQGRTGRAGWGSLGQRPTACGQS